MNITVAGVGYVGLSLAVLLSQNNNVTAITTTKEKAEKLNQFLSPIKDSEIERFFKEVKENKRTLHLQFTTDKQTAYKNAEIVIIATPTNYDEDTHIFDTSQVEDVIEHVLLYNPDALMVIKSTVPVGYTVQIQQKYGVQRILFSPEFLRESMALYDNLHPSRIIVGALKEQKAEAEMFAKLLRDAALLSTDPTRQNEIPILLCSPSEAESIKLFANTYLALRVSYFNELDTFASTKHMDSSTIIKGVCMDPRIGDHYNNPSFGYGGYCLPKDTKQLLSSYDRVPQNLIGAVVTSNKTRKHFIAEEIIKKQPGCVGIFRLTMKSNSDNFRASAVLDILDQIKQKGIPIIIYEPAFNETVSEFMGCKIMNDFRLFKDSADIILANRYDESLDDVKEKVYTRDLYLRD